MGDRLKDRIDRIYAALGASAQEQMAALPSEVKKTHRVVSFRPEFRGAQTQPQLENLAYLVVYNVAHLYDHLRKWARDHGREPDQVKQVVDECPALQIIRDLSNVDKHGGHDRTPRSGKKLSLVNIRPILRLQTRPEKDSWVTARLGRPWKGSGDGSITTVLTGEIVDEDGETVGDLHKVACEAMAAWESLVKEWKASG